jgi:hypothetical protein
MAATRKTRNTGKAPAETAAKPAKETVKETTKDTASTTETVKDAAPSTETVKETAPATETVKETAPATETVKENAPAADKKIDTSAPVARKRGRPPKKTQIKVAEDDAEDVILSLINYLIYVLNF